MITHPAKGTKRTVYPRTWAQKCPDKPAYIMAATGEVVTYRELDQRSNQVAHYWRLQGLGVGDHVAVLMENNAQYLEVMWAALRSGLVITPINTHLTASETSYIVENCGARSLITSTKFADSIEPVLAACPTVQCGLVVGGTAAGLGDYHDAVAAMPSDPVDGETLGSDMHYSSGTTGLPKGGIQPTVSGHPATTEAPLLPFFQSFGLDADTVFLSPGAPLYHAAPGRFAQFVTALGGTAVIMDKFDSHAALDAIDRYNVTHSQWVPTMFVRMLRLPDAVRASYKGNSHRVAIHAAAPCPVWAKREMIDWWGPVLYEYYSGSEGGATTLLDSEEWLAHPGSVGKAQIGTIHITDDETGLELPRGQMGTVRFDCPDRPVFYRDDPEKTRNAYDRNGWSTVGDIGYLDDDDYLYLTDRKSYMIISGGVNIYPQETEDVLLRHPAVADAAVFGIPHDEYGEEVKAAVELLDPSNATDTIAEELIAFCRTQLAAYKCPRSIDIEERLPRTEAGKLYKRRLRDRYLQASSGTGKS